MRFDIWALAISSFIEQSRRGMTFLIVAVSSIVAVIVTLVAVFLRQCADPEYRASLEASLAPTAQQIQPPVTVLSSATFDASAPVVQLCQHCKHCVPLEDGDDYFRFYYARCRALPGLPRNTQYILDENIQSREVELAWCNIVKKSPTCPKYELPESQDVEVRELRRIFSYDENKETK